MSEQTGFFIKRHDSPAPGAAGRGELESTTRQQSGFTALRGTVPRTTAPSRVSFITHSTDLVRRRLIRSSDSVGKCTWMIHICIRLTHQLLIYLKKDPIFLILYINFHSIQKNWKHWNRRINLSYSIMNNAVVLQCSHIDFTWMSSPGYADSRNVFIFSRIPADLPWCRL